MNKCELYHSIWPRGEINDQNINKESCGFDVTKSDRAKDENGDGWTEERIRKQNIRGKNQNQKSSDWHHPRNYTQSKCMGDWVLPIFVDWLSNRTEDQIQRVTNRTHTNSALLTRNHCWNWALWVNLCYEDGWKGHQSRKSTCPVWWLSRGSHWGGQPPLHCNKSTALSCWVFVSSHHNTPPPSLLPAALTRSRRDFVCSVTVNFQCGA